MLVTKEFLKKHDACADGYNYWVEQNKPELKDFAKQALKDSHFNWANWLIVRCLGAEDKIRYAIFAAEQVLSIYEKKYPEDKRPRKAIEAAKKVLTENTVANRKAAAAAAAAVAASASAASAASAADAADAAAFAAYATYAAYEAYATADTAADAAYAAYAAADAADKTLKIKIIDYGLKLIYKENNNE